MLCRTIAISPLHRQSVGQHRHDGTEIILTLRGSGYDLLEEEKLPFEPGSILVVEPGRPHGRQTGPNGFQDMYICLDDPRALRGLREHSFRDDANRTIEKLFSAAYAIFYRQIPGSAEMTDSIVQVICRMLQSAEPVSGAGSAADRVRNEILQRYTDPEFKVGEALEQSGYCADYARRIFQEEVGIAPLEYLEGLRLRYAEKLLEQRTEPPRSIGEIALLSGYFDANYFSRAFRKRTGISPREYRKQKNRTDE